jgi:putative ABC transport system permease protein
VDLNEALKEGGRGSGSASIGSHRTGKLLVVSEVALSLILLIGASLLIRSYRQIGNSYPGFDPHNVLSFRIALPPARYPTPDSIVSFFRRTNEKLNAVPQIESAAMTYSLPMSTVALAWEPIVVEGYAPKNSQDSIISNVRIISPDYFKTMRVPLIRGRLFDEHDTKGARETVIVDEAVAERFWPNEDAIGKRLRRNGSDSWRTVVGVVSDAKQYSAEKEPPITVYFPFEQYVARNMFLVIRTTQEPEAMVASIAQEIQSIDPDMPVFDLNTMDQRLYESLASRRFAMLLLGVFALIALALGGIGIYGVMAYSVNQRTHEMGVRLALGAQPSSILRLVVQQTLVLTATGIAIGLTAGLALTRVMSTLLYGVSSYDALTFITAPLVLGTIALLAGYIPARRAAKLDPMLALRCE